jgi:hypothetical protein
MYKIISRRIFSCTSFAAGLALTTLWNGGNKNIFHAEQQRTVSQVRKIKLIDEKLKLVPTEAEFDEFVKGYNELFVIAVTGGYGQGKSTLINELYKDSLQGVELETSDKDDHCTLGINAILIPHHKEMERAVNIPDYVDETVQRDKVSIEGAKNVGLLVLDTEGLHGPGDSNISKGDFLLLRLMRVANVIILNTHAELSSLQFKEMARLNNIIAEEFPELDHDRRPFLIVFQQRTSKPVREKKGLLRFFPSGIFPYKLFFDHIVLWSPDNLPPRGEKGIRLDITELKQELKEVQRPKREGGNAISPREIWNRLVWVEKMTPTTLEIDRADTIPYPCYYYCTLCDNRCDRKNVRNHTLHRASEGRECRYHDQAKDFKPKVSYKCRKCMESSPRLTLATAEDLVVTNPYGGLWGKRYECKQRHGVLAYEYQYPLIWRLGIYKENKDKEMKVAKFHEHQWELRGEAK